MNTKRVKRLLPHLIVFGALVTFVLYLAWQQARPPAPLPAFFDDHTPIDQAVARADRLALVYASADWCAPCRHMRQTTLRDPEVLDWLSRNALCLYLDIDRRPAEAQRLGISAVPTFILYRDGRPVARASGAMGPREFLAFLNAAGPG